MSAGDSPLAGKVALVTGGGRGIGAALAVAFARQGASLWCIGRTRADLERTAATIHAAGGRAACCVADVRDGEAMKAAVGEIDRQEGGLDLLVANAGVIPAPSAAGEARSDWWRDVMETNFMGALNTIVPALPLLRRRRGKIIVIGSGAGRGPVARMASYSCAKSALWMLVRCLGEELREDGISINELIPGPVITERQRSFSEKEGPAFLKNEWIKSPDDVAPLALFLASQPEGAGPTGQSFSLTRRQL